MGEADRGRLGGSEDHLRDDCLVSPHRIALERVERRDAAFIGGDGGELSAPRRVAGGVDVGDGAAKIWCHPEP